MVSAADGCERCEAESAEYERQWALEQQAHGPVLARDVEREVAAE